MLIISVIMVNNLFPITHIPIMVRSVVVKIKPMVIEGKRVMLKKDDDDNHRNTCDNRDNNNNKANTFVTITSTLTSIAKLFSVSFYFIRKILSIVHIPYIIAFITVVFFPIPIIIIITIY